MQTGRHETFSTRLEELGVTCRVVPRTDLTAAIAAETTHPAVASRSLAKEAWLSDEGITVDPTPADVWEATTGITKASFAIGPYGSLYLDHDGDGSEFISLFVEHHIAVIQAEDIEPDMTTAFDRVAQRVQEDRESGIIATGPSSTADMGELVRGAHGPEAVTVIVVEEEEAV